ncbi:MAG: oxygen-independent coproporphyrinogen III oxidase [Gammaproteobacteria bacterium]|nr:oxygen-independent coproporphyrinogen III oxidase [Gammaproteobacteria bacterium]MDP2142433.1 oxygen-independent coproporphyrinogen III oxidase [Gammaproteobacteria bacterium]MDP2348772.1 oxygen-independent coproporphyrinogen III oxidase [Gammaproteobacteria bacterium]
MNHQIDSYQLNTMLSSARIGELLKKYDRSGPRYTSYPPATEFKTLTAQVYLDALLQRGYAALPSDPISVYIHIPFCSTPCFYCGCNKVITRNPSAVRKYLDHLRKEMALLRLQTNLHQRPVTQLHLGGGTPTFLDDAEMTELIHHTSHYFNLVNHADRDYSVEVDPRTVNLARIQLLRGLGFNRISLGVQDFDDDVQCAINRQQSVASISALVSAIRICGFRSLNFDLIYGLPLQTLESIDETLRHVIALSPDRISYYNYAHLPERFPAQRAIRAEDIPSASVKLQMLTTIIGTLTAAGYEYIGIDHFVKKDDPLARAQAEGKLCRNFQGYSVEKSQELVGLGVSSISSTGFVFAQNAVQLERYYQALDANQLPIERGLVSKLEDVLRREIIQQLTCYRSLNIDAIEKEFNIDFAQHFSATLHELEQFERDGLIRWVDPKHMTVTTEGTLLLRNLCMAFDEYLQRSTPLRPLFSRAI